MAKISKPAAGGVPEWIVTYGDMMSLLLCFFILLAAMANYDKQDKRMKAVIEAIREAFGVPGQHGQIIDDELDINSQAQELIHILRTQYSEQRGDAVDEGADGSEDQVRALRRIDEYQFDFPILFDRFSAELTPDARQAVERVAERLRGHRSRIEIRGHASREPPPPSSGFKDAFDCSLARAITVRDALIAAGVEPERLRIAAAGAEEPVAVNAYTPDARASNHRVELYVYNVSVEDYRDAAIDAARQTPADSDAPDEP